MWRPISTICHQQWFPNLTFLSENISWRCLQSVKVPLVFALCGSDSMIFVAMFVAPVFRISGVVGDLITRISTSDWRQTARDLTLENLCDDFQCSPFVPSMYQNWHQAITQRLMYVGRWESSRDELNLEYHFMFALPRQHVCLPLMLLSSTGISIVIEHQRAVENDGSVVTNKLFGPQCFWFLHSAYMIEVARVSNWRPSHDWLCSNSGNTIEVSWRTKTTSA